MDSAKWQKIKDLAGQALDLPFGERAGLLTSEQNEEIRREAEKLLAAIEDSEDFIEQPFLVERGIAGDLEADSLTGEKIGDYLLHQRLGTGGMGVVYLAEKLNSDFKQKVAIKLIKRGMDTEAIIRRFGRERRILSALRHPNIAQLLDGGISEAGLPFFVLEYIEGQPLNEFCDRKNASIEERLKLFRLVCAAVEHAHQNLIVHRDLKPSNLLVTDDGVPKLLDFGIAKLLSDDESESTQTQHKIFTPEYAAPEQILGQQATTPADIYSLGVILYQLLSGQRPFETKGKSFDEIVKSVCETEPERPSALIMTRNIQKANTQKQSSKPKFLRGDLDNIVLKALRKEPAERYSTIQQFSEDIKRHLEGLPITARPQTLNYRFGKYVRRHRAGVLATALVLMSLVGGISVAVWQAAVARRERIKAEQNFNDVRKLANSVVFEIHDAIESLPGSTPARELLVSRALEYLDKLATENQQDIALQNELADAYDKIAKIQGGFATNQLGNREKAEENYRKALTIREKIASTEPKNPVYQRNVAWSYYNLGNIFYMRVDVLESLRMFQTADEIMQDILQQTPDDPKMNYTYGKILTQEGFLTCVQGDYDKCMSTLESSISLWETLITANPDRDNLRSLAYVLELYADAVGQIEKDYDKARKCNQRSLEISQNILAGEPGNTEYQKDVGVSYNNLATNYQSLGDYRRALDNAQKAREIFTLLVKADPANEEFNQINATNEILISGLLIKSGKAEEAILNLNKSLAVLEQQTKNSPNDKIALFRISNVYRQLGYGYQLSKSSSNRKSACQYFQNSYDIAKEFLGDGIPAGSDDEIEIKAVAEEVKQCGGKIEN